MVDQPSENAASSRVLDAVQDRAPAPILQIETLVEPSLPGDGPDLQISKEESAAMDDADDRAHKAANEDLMLARAQIRSLRDSPAARIARRLRRLGYRPWHNASFGLDPDDLGHRTIIIHDEPEVVSDILGTVGLIGDSSFVEVELEIRAQRDTCVKIGVDFGHGIDQRYIEDWWTRGETTRHSTLLRLPAAPLAVVVSSPTPDGVTLVRCRARTVGRIRFLSRALLQKFKSIRSLRGLMMSMRKAAGVFRRDGLAGLMNAIGSGLGSVDRYEAWLELNTPGEAMLAAMRKEAESWADAPLISVITPVYNTPLDTLEAMVESVRAQAYPNWEHCLVNDCSSDPAIRAALDTYAAIDPRIRVVHRGENGHISRASNDGLKIARGEFICLLDHDDVFQPHALHRVVSALRENPGLDWLYSDEDKILPGGARGDPFFKPDWSPQYFRACMYTCHLSAYRRSVVERVGGFRPEFDGAQDYDLALRISAAIDPSRIHHIADVLYSWRIIPESTAGGPDAKPYAHDAAQRAIQEDLDRRGIAAEVGESVSPGFHRVNYKIPGTPRVSLVIPTRPGRGMFEDGEDYFVRRCIKSVRALSSYPDIEIVLVTDGEPPADLVGDIEAAGARTVVFDEAFNFSSKVNLGVERSTGEYVVLLNDDIEVVSPDWIERMLELAQLDEVGAVGARLLFPSGGLQHAGVMVLDGNPTHAYYNMPPEHPGYFNSNRVLREYIAVTAACLMSKRGDFLDAGGLDPEFPLNFNDVDYCLRLRRRGLSSVMMPDAELLHHESVTKSGVHQDEIDRFHARWRGVYPSDPHCNVDLTENGLFDIAPRPGPLMRGDMERY